jgi:hypothetical protein
VKKDMGIGLEKNSSAFKQVGSVLKTVISRGNASRITVKADDHIISDFSVVTAVVLMLVSPRTFFWAVLALLLSPLNIEVTKPLDV